jgi:hypothetical protein
MVSQYFYFLFFCTLVSMVFGIKNQTLFSKYLTLFFLSLSIIEIICYKIPVTDGVYNIWYPIEFTFYCFFIFFYLSNKIRKKLIRLPIITLIFCFSYHLFHLKGITFFFTIGYIIFSLILLIFVILKSYELLTDENELRFPFKIPLVWFLFGLICDLTSVLLFGMKNYILANNFKLGIVLQHVNQYLSSLQYSCFILYYYCAWKYQNWNLL